jgi:hypothetical protein
MVTNILVPCGTACTTRLDEKITTYNKKKLNGIAALMMSNVKFELEVFLHFLILGCFGQTNDQPLKNYQTFLLD